MDFLIQHCTKAFQIDTNNAITFLRRENMYYVNKNEQNGNENDKEELYIKGSIQNNRTESRTIHVTVVL